MHIPGPVYERLPVVYIVAGVLLGVVSYRNSAAGWSTPVGTLAALAVLAGIVLILRRRSSRLDAAHYDRRSLDD